MTSFSRDASPMFDTGPPKRQATESITDRMARQEREARDALVEFWQPRSVPKIKGPTRDAALRSLIETAGLENLPPTVVMLAMRRRDITPEVMRETPLQGVLESLDAQFSGIDLPGRPEGTERMKEAERLFLSVIAEEYQSGQFAVEREEAVDVRVFAAANGIG